MIVYVGGVKLVASLISATYKIGRKFFIEDQH